VDGIISDGVRDVPVLRRIAPGVPLRVIPNAVATPKTPASDGPLRPVALWVARLAHPKEPLVALEAWERVAAAVPGATLLMCGTGPLEAKVRAAAAASPVASQIEFRGFVDDLTALRARASVFVLPTRVEGGLTMATLEAMGNGLVPVVSDAGDAPLLEQLDMGRCVRDAGPTAFADAVIGVFSDPEAFERMRANALAYSREKRTPADLVADTVAFYQDVLVRAAGGTRP
jgi:glycosyltransferase involved in cell wall biosynthesis